MAISFELGEALFPMTSLSSILRGFEMGVVIVNKFPL